MTRALARPRTAAAFAKVAASSSTRAQYTTQWRTFSRWCKRWRFDALPAPPSVVAAYIADLAQTRKPSTIDQALAAIRKAHLLAGESTPTTAPEVSEVRAGIRRSKGVAPRQARPLTVDGLRKVLKQIGREERYDHGAIRSMSIEQARAIVLVGWASALRSSELVGLDVDDLIFDARGVQLRIRRSKVDQEGKGRTIGIPYANDPQLCPVMALREHAKRIGETGTLAHYDKRGTRVGVALFRSPTKGARLGRQAVSDLVARLCVRAGLGAGFSSHSLRSGLVTTAALAGKSTDAIARQTGHKSIDVLLGYIRDVDVLGDSNVCRGLL